ncbi:MAG: translation initiation factor [Candidatus Altiarchaeota archaeon]|nr:translation initiation factor [Candidatus Altiarchaeota archaeon]
MPEICNKCGLPKELCVCGEISKEQARVVIRVEKRRYGKNVTVVEGLEGNDTKDMAKTLKSKLACGGTSKKGLVELQGDHKNKVREILIGSGFPEATIDVK